MAIEGMTTAEVPSGAFRVTVRFEGEQALLRVRGELDVFTAPALGAALDAVIASGFLYVVVDLAELEFADHTGLRVVSSAASRVAASGGGLTVRSPSPMVVRIFDITDMNRLLQVELESESRQSLGPEQPLQAPRSMHGSEPQHAAHDLWTVASVPADNDVVDGALRLIVALARATVSSADGVSVSLRRHGRLVTVAASDQTISDMDANQYATAEGPCVDASVEGRWFHATSLDDESRWPMFTPRAKALGINAILSSPLLAEDRPVGALNIYSRTAGSFMPQDQELAAVFATEASVILTSAGVDVSDDQLATRLAEALRNRQIIAQAEGVIMEREGISEERAYSALREFSQKSGQRLRERARDVVAATQSSDVGYELDGGSP
jgi:anti-anti-sigma factor